MAARAAALVAVCGSMVGCSLFRSPTEREVVVPGRPFQDIWSEFIRVTVLNGHEVDVANTDVGKRVFQSKWNSQPMGFQGGRRTRVHARFKRDEGTPIWRVFFYVERERVTDMERELFPTEEDWERAGQDGLMEELIGAQLSLSLGVEPELETTIDVDVLDSTRRR